METGKLSYERRAESAEWFKSVQRMVRNALMGYHLQKPEAKLLKDIIDESTER